MFSWAEPSWSDYPLPFKVFRYQEETGRNHQNILCVHTLVIHFSVDSWYQGEWEMVGKGGNAGERDHHKRAGFRPDMEGYATRPHRAGRCGWGRLHSSSGPPSLSPLQEWSLEGRQDSIPPAPRSCPLFHCPLLLVHPYSSISGALAMSKLHSPCSRQITERVCMKVHVNDPDLGHPRTAALEGRGHWGR